jgi:hypothetical protein
MNALATDDIDPALLMRMREELSPDVEMQLDPRVIGLRSVEPPSWVQFFAEAPWWGKALGAYAALYVAEIVKEAGKETWKQRARVAQAVISSTNGLAKFAASLARLRRDLPVRSRLVLGLPVPDDYFGVRFELKGRDEELMAAEIALFVRHVSGIQALIESEALKERVTGAVWLTLLERGAMSVSWMDNDSLTIQERVLELPHET